MTITLRANVGLAARAARRVFPLLVLSNYKVDECDLGIAVAEAFAAGEPGSPIRAREVADEIVGQPIQGPKSEIDYAFNAASHASSAAAYAFRATTVAPATRNCAHNAVKEADRAVESAQRAAEERKAVEVGNAILEERSTIERDKRYSGEEHELGPTVALGDEPLKGLWSPGAAPQWYQDGITRWRERWDIPEVRVATAEDFLKGDRAHFVWWDGRVGATPLETIARQIDEVRQAGGPDPGLLVYAPDIDEGPRMELVIRGAIVDTHVLRALVEEEHRPIPDAIREWNAIRNEGWRRDSHGGRYYAGARARWRFGRSDPEAAVEEEPEVHPPRIERPRLGTYEDYAAVFAFLHGPVR